VRVQSPAGVSFFIDYTTTHKLEYGHQHHNVTRFPYSVTGKTRTVEPE